MKLRNIFLALLLATPLVACGGEDNKQGETASTSQSAPYNLDPNKITEVDDAVVAKFNQLTKDFLKNEPEKKLENDFAKLNDRLATYQKLNQGTKAVFQNGNYVLPQRYSNFEFYANFCDSKDPKALAVLNGPDPDIISYCFLTSAIIETTNRGLTREQILSYNAYTQKDSMSEKEWNAIVNNQAGFTYVDPTAGK